MENIMIVDASSTGINYINDIASRNYHPVVLYESFGEKHIKLLDDAREAVINRYKDVATFIYEQDTFEETVELVKKYNPKFIIPGSEGGVVLAMKLVGALGLEGNPVENIPNYTEKDKMHAALKKAGIRYIKGELVDTLEQALDFFDSNKLKGCVVKPTHGAGSVGVRICNNRDELIKAYKELENSLNMYGEEGVKTLIQEKIDGTEYIVNTVSYNGVHRLSSIWRYQKQVVEGGGKVYDYCESINSLETGCTRLVKYAFDTLDAIGYKYGAVHGEYMVDEQGPVLIETNCRPMGYTMKASFVDPIFGHHESDNVLDTYLNPEWHYQKAKEPYKAYSYGMIKSLITKKESNVNVMPILDIVKRLKSFSTANLGMAISGELPRTVDLETSSGTIFMSNKDKAALHHDLDFLRKVEKDYFGIFFNDNRIKETNKPENLEIVENILKMYSNSGSTIVLSDEDKLDINAVIVDQKTIDDTKHMFNLGIMDLTSNDIGVEEYIDLFYRLTDHIRTGGKIIVPERSYWHFPHGLEGIESLCEAANLKVEAPTIYDGNVVVISKI